MKIGDKIPKLPVRPGGNKQVTRIDKAEILRKIKSGEIPTPDLWKKADKEAEEAKKWNRLPSTEKRRKDFNKKIKKQG